MCMHVDIYVYIRTHTFVGYIRLKTLHFYWKPKFRRYAPSSKWNYRSNAVSVLKYGFKTNHKSWSSLREWVHGKQMSSIQMPWASLSKDLLTSVLAIILTLKSSKPLCPSKKHCPFKGFWVYKLNSFIPHGHNVRDFSWWQYAITFPNCNYVHRLPSIIWPGQRGTAPKRRFWTEVKSFYQQDVYTKLELWYDFYDICSSRTSRGKVASLKAS